MPRAPALPFLLLALGLCPPAFAQGAAVPQRPTDSQNPADILALALAESDRTWKSATAAVPPDGLASRSLFAAALAYARANTHPERVETLLSVAARMQEGDPAQPAYGNFRWAWGHEGYLDLNAVEFSLQVGAVLWLLHRDNLTPSARAQLRTLMDKGLEGVLRHRVREGYTNIALMNAGNLIILGEALDRPDAVAAGVDRLDRIVISLWEEGVREYASPTYYGVNLTDVLMIERFAQNTRARVQARAVRELLWTDIALNWFPPAGRLAGPHSRSYDYLRGLGELDGHLRLSGWIQSPKPFSFHGHLTLTHLETPTDPAHTALSRKFPRLITATWGPERDQTRTHFLCEDVTLGSAAASYGGRMDMPLTVDLPGPRERVRGYFIPDGRGDPYGKIRTKESQAHQKTIHLEPFWTAAQRRTDALGLAVYRPADVPPETTTLESHFVLPETVDGVWVDGQALAVAPRRKAVFPLLPGGSLVVRQGTAMVGLRVPWSADVAGAPASAALVCDGNPHGAMRLTVAHHAGGNALPRAGAVGAAFWVRIGSGLKTDAERDAWRARFEVARPEVKAADGAVSVRVPGVDGPVAVGGKAPFAEAFAPEPAAPRHTLALDGGDLGERLLRGVEPVASLLAREAGAPAAKVPARGGVYLEAEAGLPYPPVTVADDPSASGKRFAWMPVPAGERGASEVGRVHLRLDAAEAGVRHLWARVLTPTPANDSFFVTLGRGRETLLYPVEWHAGTRKEWTWVRLNGPGGRPLDISLPKGFSHLDLRVREGGAKLDRVFLTTDPDAKPK